jgi:hypothetical protein
MDSLNRKQTELLGMIKKSFMQTPPPGSYAKPGGSAMTGALQGGMTGLDLAHTGNTLRKGYNVATAGNSAARTAAVSAGKLGGKAMPLIGAAVGVGTTGLAGYNMYQNSKTVGGMKNHLSTRAGRRDLRETARNSYGLVGAGIGAGIGAFAGGVGAIPGAAIGGAIGTGVEYADRGIEYLQDKFSGYNRGMEEEGIDMSTGRGFENDPASHVYALLNRNPADGISQGWSGTTDNFAAGQDLEMKNLNKQMKAGTL